MKIIVDSACTDKRFTFESIITSSPSWLVTSKKSYKETLHKLFSLIFFPFIFCPRLGWTLFYFVEWFRHVTEFWISIWFSFCVRFSVCMQVQVCVWMCAQCVTVWIARVCSWLLIIAQTENSQAYASAFVVCIFDFVSTVFNFFFEIKYKRRRSWKYPTMKKENTTTWNSHCKHSANCRMVLVCIYNGLRWYFWYSVFRFLYRTRICRCGAECMVWRTTNTSVHLQSVQLFRTMQWVFTEFSPRSGAHVLALCEASTAKRDSNRCAPRRNCKNSINVRERNARWENCSKRK